MRRDEREAGAGTPQRKAEHIRICLEEDVAGVGVTSGFERYRFAHEALPEIDVRTIRTDTRFLGRALRVPLLISSMTGGTAEAGAINRLLAEAAEARGWAIGLGSMRAAIEDESLAATFRVRAVAPTVPIIANLGAVQLLYGYGADACARAVELAEADGLVLHLNAMQELFQPEGDTNFAGLLQRIEAICRELSVPVGVKEVGMGIDGRTAARLYDAGVAFIDVAGAGGTNWIRVEAHRRTDPIRRAAAASFADWGTPTADCVLSVRRHLPEALVIASGGLDSGVDAAKAVALGADLAGFGRSLLAGAAQGDPNNRLEAVHEQLARIEFELKAAMFGIGAGSLEALRGTERLLPRPARDVSVSI